MRNCYQVNGFIILNGYLLYPHPYVTTNLSNCRLSKVGFFLGRIGHFALAHSGAAEHLVIESEFDRNIIAPIGGRQGSERSG